MAAWLARAVQHKMRERRRSRALQCGAIFLGLGLAALLATGQSNWSDGRISMAEIGINSSTPATVASPVPCGVPATNWGAAIASNVEIQILGMQHVEGRADGTPTSNASAGHTVILLRVTNHGDARVTIAQEHVTVRTCTGQAINPIEGLDDESLRLGDFQPSATRQGVVTFAIPSDDQAQQISIEIEEGNRTGARVDCDLVVALNNTPQAADVAVGCNARGGDAKPGADAVGPDATAPAEGD